MAAASRSPPDASRKTSAAPAAGRRQGLVPLADPLARCVALQPRHRRRVHVAGDLELPERDGLATRPGTRPAVLDQRIRETGADDDEGEAR